MTDVRTRALTAARLIEPTSTSCPSAWQPNPGRRSTYRRGKTVQTTGTTSEIVFRHSCKMGLEGIVSKRKDSPYRSGRSPDWLKMKNPDCEAVRREAEEDWGKDRPR